MHLTNPTDFPAALATTGVADQTKDQVQPTDFPEALARDDGAEGGSRYETAEI